MKHSAPTTIYDIGHLTGVSIATVSRAVNPRTRHKVAPDTLRKIDAAIARHGYTPSLAARSLGGSALQTIGVMLPQSPGVFFHDYYVKVLAGISDALLETAYQFKLILSKPGDTRWDRYDFKAGEGVEGLIVTHPIHLKTAALAAGVSYEELKVLNPELRKDLTPPDPAYHLKVPAGHKDAFLANLGTYQAWKRVHAVRYQVRRGDTLPLLASRHGITVTAILEANAMAKSEKPKPGDWLLIPKAVKPRDGTARTLVKASR